ncbi:MAG TPA: penicillin-insensitive murein endopeptidase [Azospirillaceae bacterium]|nr:penicillin-insensitive murein endopeptidase [Azospirillaceae bacterium]
MWTLILAAALVVAVEPAKAEPARPSAPAAAWHRVAGPSPGPARVIGDASAGCLAGAATLPPEGEGYQAIRLSRRRNHGHPELVDYVRGLGARASAAGIGTVLIGDMSQPRGGPMDFGHASHQTGLDVDVWFRLDPVPLPRDRREELDLPTMVRPGPNPGVGSEVDPARFGRAQVELLRLAAADPRVDRIFVNPPIKLAVCRQVQGDRGWLGRLRPWVGHDAHFHVRLRCPAGSPECRPQAPPPPGDGCGDELMSWFRPREPGRAGAPPPAKPALPPACAAVLAAR